MADHRPASDYPPARIDPPATPTQAGLTTLAVAVVVVAALYLGRSVLLPVTLALLLSFVLAPLASLLRRLYLGRVLSVLIAVLLGLGTLLAISGLIGLQIAELAQDVPYYVTTIEQKIGTLRGLTLDRVSAFINDMSSHAPIAPPAEPAAPPQASEAAATPKPIPVEVHQPDPTAVQIAESILGPVVEPLSTTAIVFIVTIFVLLQREDLRDRMIRLFGS
ncbi:MAG: AI-2E family transporter, partial [Acetobacteraceae bacterium]